MKKSAHSPSSSDANNTSIVSKNNITIEKKIAAASARLMQRNQKAYRELANK